MLTGKPAAVPSGGACAFRLPRYPSCASQARSLLAATMRELDFAADPIEDAKLAVSELVTNAHAHASSPSSSELWVWARTHPAPELVVSVYDSHRGTWPVAHEADLLDERGKGLAIVEALSSDTGTNLTRSRLTTSAGKSVWFALPLPTDWPAANRIITPATAASQLSDVLRTRGIPATQRDGHNGNPVINIGVLNIGVEPSAFSWRSSQGHARQPLIDLQEAAERIVSCHETTHPSAAPG